MQRDDPGREIRSDLRLQTGATIACTAKDAAVFAHGPKPDASNNSPRFENSIMRDGKHL